MLSRRGRFAFLCSILLAGIFTLEARCQQAAAAPAASGARMLLLPRRIVSGERATLAVLDVNGRLTPGVTVDFSNGDRFTTDATGRAIFVAPLNPGVIFGSIAGRTGRVATAVLTSVEAASASIEISSVPRVASMADRFEILGKGFCGDADANQITIAGQPALVLASSPTALVVLPPPDLQPGSAAVQVSCAKRQASPFSVTLVGLELQADSSPLKADEHRALTVRVRGTASKIELEARNLAPEIAELTGGNPVRATSSGGAENSAKFEAVGRKNGSFLISIRLVPSLRSPLPRD
ncbi:MAG TPA: IPT/TIG domain-containing protein [Candidatus Acidoferrum sp.]|nr:IPT/TIG domain-containing protein [Candidatus Acidoferrum sp.]